MRNAYDEQLRGLLDMLMQMGGLVEQMLHLSMGALREASPSLQAEIYEKEARVNLLQNRIDEECVKVTAQQQPVAGDARFVFVASRTATDLERVGDQAINIFQNANHARLGGAIPDDIDKMARLVQSMLADALAALVTRDVELAEKVFADERSANTYRDRIFQELLRRMTANPSAVNALMSLILISRNLERVGDHATNIAEEVIYLVRGQEVRHQFDRANLKMD
jgi:phosphate transport system protein